MGEVLAHFEELYKHYGATRAVDGVTLDIYKGEVRGLVGENGSGKSTLLSLVAGINRPDSGSILFSGRSYAPGNQAQAISCGVSMIVQEINTLPGLSVAENIFLGQEQEFTRFGIRNLKKMNQLAQSGLDLAGLKDISPHEDVAHYSLEQRKMVELVRAAYFDPQLLMIDETSTALSHIGREEMYRLISDTKVKGNSVIFISHDLREVLTTCDRVTVMRDGKIVTTVETSSVTEDDLKNYMVGRELSGHYYREDYGIPISEEVVMSVKNLSCGNYCKDISFDLHRGEILGIGGLSESGMHELGRALYGVEHEMRGEIFVEGISAPLHGIQSAVKAGVGYVSKNRDAESLFQQADILDNLAVPCLDMIKNGIFVSPAKMKEFAEREADVLSVKRSDINQSVVTLSGGNKQKVALTKWIARDTEIFVMDSPTRGIDVAVKAVIYDLLMQLKEEGKSMIVISEELLELIGCCDRILMLRDGAISQEFKRSPELGEKDLVQAMI